MRSSPKTFCLCCFFYFAILDVDFFFRGYSNFILENSYMSLNSNFHRNLKEVSSRLNAEISEFIQDQKSTNFVIQETWSSFLLDLNELCSRLEHILSLDSLNYLIVPLTDYLALSALENGEKLLCHEELSSKLKLLLSTLRFYQRTIAEYNQMLPPQKVQAPTSIEEIERDIAATPEWVKALFLYQTRSRQVFLILKQRNF